MNAIATKTAEMQDRSSTKQLKPQTNKSQLRQANNPNWQTLILTANQSPEITPSEQQIYDSIGSLLYQFVVSSDLFSEYRLNMRKKLWALLTNLGGPGETTEEERRSIWDTFCDYRQEIQQNTRLSKASWFVLENAYQTETTRLLESQSREDKRALEILTREYRLARTSSDRAGELLDYDDFQNLHHMLTHKSHVQSAFVQVAYERNRELIGKLDNFKRDIHQGNQPDTLVLSQAKRRIKILTTVAPQLDKSFNRAAIISLQSKLTNAYENAVTADYNPSLLFKITSGLKGIGKGIGNAVAAPFVEAFMLGHDARVWLEKKFDSDYHLDYQSLPGKLISGQEGFVETYDKAVEGLSEQMFEADQQIRHKGDFEGLFTLATETLAELYMPKSLRSKKGKSSNTDLDTDIDTSRNARSDSPESDTRANLTSENSQTSNTAQAWNDPLLSEQGALDLYKNSGVVKPLTDTAVLEKLQQGYRFNPDTRKWSKPFKIAANQRKRKSTAGFLNNALKRISDPLHPLHNLAVVVGIKDGNPVYDWRKTTRITKSGKTQTGRYPGNEDGAVVQVGHENAFASGEAEKFMIEDADFNIADGSTIESKGAFSYKTSVVVEGVSVDLRSLEQWERLGVVPAGTVASATQN